jgi:hypothetical protein
MRYAVVYKLNSEPLDRFVKHKGGITARFYRCMGRHTANQSERRSARE